MTGRPTVAGIERALRVVRALAPPTPLVRSPILSSELGCELWIKNEAVSPVASFKWRGALNALTHEAAGAPEVVTASTGNHGQGVAWAAATMHVASRVFLPASAPALKRAKIELFGARIELVDGDLEAARSAAMATGSRFIDDGGSVAVIEGAATVGLEIAEQLPDVDFVFVPMGSGSLAGGVALAMKARRPQAQVIAVQSSAGPAMTESFLAGHAVERPSLTLAEGLRCAVPEPLALSTILDHLDEAVLVSDADALDGVRAFVEKAQLLVEPSAAVGLPAAFKRRESLAGKRVVLVVTGANVMPDVLSRALEGRT